MKSLFNQYTSLFKKFIPAQESTPSVGLDISMGSCKMVELTSSDDSFELLSWAIEPIQNGDASGSIKKILRGLKTPTKTVFTSVFGKGTMIRYIDMPIMSLDDLRKSFAIEADKYFPFPHDQIYMDCYILQPDAGNKKMSVLVAVAKREIIEERIKLLTDHGIQADFIGINSIALANTFNVLGDIGQPGNFLKNPLSSKGDKNAVALLDVGESVSHLMILMNNLPCFDRDIFIGGKHISQSISHALGISLSEAERLKVAPKDKLQDMLGACESVVMNIVSEIKLSLDYFITEKNIPVTKILLTGGGSMLEGLESILSKGLETPTEKWDPMASLKINPDIAGTALKENTCKLGVALGLALYQ